MDAGAYIAEADAAPAVSPNVILISQAFCFTSDWLIIPRYLETASVLILDFNKPRFKCNKSHKYHRKIN